MQKYAFFPVCANIPGEILLPPTIFFYNKIQATEETKIRQLRKQKAAN